MFKFVFSLVLISSATSAFASTEFYPRAHETMIVVRGVAEDRDAVDLFLAMKAPVAEIGNMWRKQIRVDGKFDLVCRASLITKALAICNLKMAPGVSETVVAGAGEKFEKSFTTRDGRLSLVVGDAGELKISYVR